MTEPGVPPAVERFLLDHVASVEQLEVVLLLHRGRDRGWTADAIARELRSQPRSVAAHLAALVSHGIVRAAGDGFAIAAAPDLDALLDAVAGSYAERRYGVIQIIFSKPNDNVRIFADAFRFRKD